MKNPWDDQEKNVDAKLKKMQKVRDLVKQMVAAYPDYQIRTWCKVNEKELAGDLLLDWNTHKETLSLPDKELAIECWKDVLSMTAREVAVLVTNYGK